MKGNCDLSTRYLVAQVSTITLYYTDDHNKFCLFNHGNEYACLFSFPFSFCCREEMWYSICQFVGFLWKTLVGFNLWRGFLHLKDGMIVGKVELMRKCWLSLAFTCLSHRKCSYFIVMEKLVIHCFHWLVIFFICSRFIYLLHFS